MARQIEFEIKGVRGRYTLLEEWAPKTTAVLWDLLPHESPIYHGRLSGDVALFGMRDPRIKELPALEMAVSSIYKGYIVAATFPDRGFFDITLSYGVAEMRRAMGRAYATPVAEIEPADAAAFLPLLAATRKGGEAKVAVRRVG